MPSQRRVILAIADLAAVALAIAASAGFVFGWPAAGAFLLDRAAALLVPMAVALPAFYLAGLYSTRRLRSARDAIVPAVKAVALILAISLAAWAPGSGPEVGRRFVLELGMLIGAGVITVRLAVSRSRGVLDACTLVIGSPRLASEIAALMRQHPDAPLRIVGIIPYPDARDGDREVPWIFPVLGNLDALEDVVAGNRVVQILLPPRVRDDVDLVARLRRLSYRGVSLVGLVSLYEELAQEIPLEHVDDDWLFDAAFAASKLHIRKMKRVVDVIASVLLLVPAAPLLALAAAAIKLTSRGPVVFSQERSGLGGKPFPVLKLRTMYQDAEKLTGPVWSTDDDPRITRAGKILRKFRIDELPQLWNVLRGDMSLVGPRPERPVFVEKLSEVIPHYRERLLVRPGITGWAQVLAPYAASVGDSARKLQFDLYYTKNLSLSLDLVILLLTARTVLFGRERVQGGMSAGQQAAAMPVFEPSNMPAMVEASAGLRRARSGRDDVARA
jgi:exopolysaccharide biosynthesis polyprenyl glycosylphosphotransferase